jgi:hypothetical protein
MEGDRACWASFLGLLGLKFHPTATKVPTELTETILVTADCRIKKGRLARTEDFADLAFCCKRREGNTYSS